MMPKESGSRLKERMVLAVVAVLVLGAILGGAYYRDDLSTYFRLHGWDAASAEKVVRDFVRSAHAGDATAVKLLDGTRARPIMTGGKITGVSHMGDRGPADVALENLIPTPEIKATSSRVRYISKFFGIAVQYADGQWAEFGVDRTPAGLRIVDVSDVLSDRRLPQRD